MIIDLIKNEIKKSPVSRYAISQSTGVKESVLSRLMSGERGLSLHTAETLMKYFGYEVKKSKLKGRRK